MSCGVVPAAERLHEPPVGAQERLALVLVGVAPDDGLAAAVVEAREGVLVGHPAGELKGVVDGVGLARVRVEPRAAETGTEGGRVDRDDRPQAGGLVVTEDDLLVT
jgi:hypothetical protein